MTTTFILENKTYLDPKVACTWVAGWINGGGSSLKVLQEDGNFKTCQNSQVPFIKIDGSLTASLSDSTNGNDRLIFTVCPDQPSPLQVNSSSQPIEYTSYPYANAPGVPAPGPYDVFEFGQDAQDDLSAVNGFGLNLSFTVGTNGTSPKYGVNPNAFTRGQICKAFNDFITNEAKSLSSATAYSELLYNSPITPDAPTPPIIDKQYFAIADPNDMLVAKTLNYQKSCGDALETFWDDTLIKFFTIDNYLSINLGGNRIYSGQCTQQTNPNTGVSSPAYTLSYNGTSYTFYMPLATGKSKPGLAGAQYVFQQAFNDLTPAGSSDDAGLLQDNIWMALCRGVACGGTSTTSITNGESTTYWNNSDNWYQSANASHLYAKFLHYSTIDGKDSRNSGTPIFYGNAAYGFSMDENPDGPYSGPNVPSKTPSNVPDGSTVIITVGPWDALPM